MVVNLPASAGDMGSTPESSRSPGVGNDNLTGKFHEQRSLVGCRPWGCKELDTIEHLCMCTHNTHSDTHEDPVSGNFLEVSCNI